MVLDEATEYLRGTQIEDLITYKLHSFCSSLLFSTSTSRFLSVYYPTHCCSIHVLFTDPEDPLRVTEQTRRLGLIVCRGTSVMTVAPSDGTEEIENPFAAAQG